MSFPSRVARVVTHLSIAACLAGGAALLWTGLAVVDGELRPAIPVPAPAHRAVPLGHPHAPAGFMPGPATATEACAPCARPAAPSLL